MRCFIFPGLLSLVLVLSVTACERADVPVQPESAQPQETSRRAGDAFRIEYAPPPQGLVRHEFKTMGIYLPADWEVSVGGLTLEAVSPEDEFTTISVLRTRVPRSATLDDLCSDTLKVAKWGTQTFEIREQEIGSIFGRTCSMLKYRSTMLDVPSLTIAYEFIVGSDSYLIELDGTPSTVRLYGEMFPSWLSHIEIEN